jgi:ferredoxin--NADP+ reductase
VPELNAIVTQRIDFAPGLMVLRVAPDGWELPDFLAGQFAVLGLPASAPRSTDSEPEDSTPPAGGFIRRAYSVASASHEREYLEFYIVQVRSGQLTPRLFALNVGDRVWLGPKVTGMFTLDQVPADQHLVFVATGTGLAPYISMIRTHLAADQARRFAVLHGARTSLDLGYRTELFQMQRLATTFRYFPTLSEPQREVVPWKGYVGFVQDLWAKGEIATAWGFAPRPEHTHVFLCGNPLMVEAMKALLHAEGFRDHAKGSPGQIHLEEYW